MININNKLQLTHHKVRMSSDNKITMLIFMKSNKKPIIRFPES